MIFKLKWNRYDWDNNYKGISTGDESAFKKVAPKRGNKEHVIFHLEKNNKELGIQFGETLPNYTTWHRFR